MKKNRPKFIKTQKRMKRLGLTVVMIVAAASAALADTTNLTMEVGSMIPDNDPNGLVLATNLTGISGGITDVTVGLNTSGGYNGDLYAYLVGPNGGFAVLLNRVGIGNGNTTGYSDSGFNITFDDSGTYDNVHYYQNDNPTITGGVLTGTWASDGENVDPLGNLVGTAPSTTTLASFYGTNPNGTWVLFLSDLSPGGISTLNDWSLTIDSSTAVPEPSTLALGAIGAGILLFVRRLFWPKTGRAKGNDSETRPDECPCPRERQWMSGDRGQEHEDRMSDVGWAEVWR